MSLREPSVTRAWKGFLVLIALAAIFLLRCALIELDSDGVRYKRFTRWHKISYSDITQCGFSVVPGVGYLRLRNKKFPFRRLFFVFYHPYVSSWRSYSANRKIIEEIQGKISSTKPSEHMPSELEKGQEDPDSTEIEKTWPQLGRCALAIILGFSFILFVRLYLGLPGQGFPPPVSDNSSPAWHFIVAWWKIGVRILGWPYNLIVDEQLLDADTEGDDD